MSVCFCGRRDKNCPCDVNHVCSELHTKEKAKDNDLRVFCGGRGYNTHVYLNCIYTLYMCTYLNSIYLNCDGLCQYKVPMKVDPNKSNPCLSEHFNLGS